MKTKTEIVAKLWKEGNSIQAIAKLMNMTTKQVHNFLHHVPAWKAHGKKRKSEALPELTECVGQLHNPYSTWQARHKPPIGKCVAWVVEDGKAKQCGKHAKRQLCSDCAHKTLPVGNTLGRRVYG
jgi:predicted transcriptional regulator